MKLLAQGLTAGEKGDGAATPQLLVVKKEKETRRLIWVLIGTIVVLLCWAGYMLHIQQKSDQAQRWNHMKSENSYLAKIWARLDKNEKQKDSEDDDFSFEQAAPYGNNEMSESEEDDFSWRRASWPRYKPNEYDTNWPGRRRDGSFTVDSFESDDRSDENDAYGVETKGSADYYPEEKYGSYDEGIFGSDDGYGNEEENSNEYYDDSTESDESYNDEDEYVDEADDCNEDFGLSDSEENAIDMNSAEAFQLWSETTDPQFEQNELVEMLDVEVDRKNHSRHHHKNHTHHHRHHAHHHHRNFTCNATLCDKFCTKRLKHKHGICKDFNATHINKTVEFCCCYDKSPSECKPPRPPHHHGHHHKHHCRHHHRHHPGRHHGHHRHHGPHRRPHHRGHHGGHGGHHHPHHSGHVRPHHGGHGGHHPHHRGHGGMHPHHGGHGSHHPHHGGHHGGHGGHGGYHPHHGGHHGGHGGYHPHHGGHSGHGGYHPHHGGHGGHHGGHGGHGGWHPHHGGHGGHHPHGGHSKHQGHRHHGHHKGQKRHHGKHHHPHELNLFEQTGCVEETCMFECQRQMLTENGRCLQGKEYKRGIVDSCCCYDKAPFKCEKAPKELVPWLW